MLEGLMCFPVLLTGLVTAPRGIGTMIAMVVVDPMIKRVDARYLILAGLLLRAYPLYMMSGFSLGLDEMFIIESGFIQGLGKGLLSVPCTPIAFATLASRLCNEGAPLSTLLPNICTSLGHSPQQAAS